MESPMVLATVTMVTQRASTYEYIIIYDMAHYITFWAYANLVEPASESSFVSEIYHTKFQLFNEKYFNQSSITHLFSLE